MGPLCVLVVSPDSPGRDERKTSGLLLVAITTRSGPDVVRCRQAEAGTLARGIDWNIGGSSSGVSGGGQATDAAAEDEDLGAWAVSDIERDLPPLPRV